MFVTQIGTLHIYAYTHGRRTQAIIFYRRFFQFVSIDERPAMGSQPNLASRSEVVSIYKCPNPQKFRADLPQIWGAKNNKLWTTFFATSALDTAYLWNETSHQQTKMPVSIYNVSPKCWPTFCDIWPRNGLDPFRHCDSPFGGHYVATIKVSTCLVLEKILSSTTQLLSALS